MTKDEAIHALCQRAYAEVGYHEGANNFTKYAQDPRISKLYGWNVQNQPWCETYVEWLFIDTFGFDDGTAMTYGGSASCATHAQLYKNNNAWSREPHKGDQIYFLSGGAINHTGIVVDVSGATITTIEGNYSDRVAVNTYYANDAKIAGYGVPNWDVVANETEPIEDGSDEETADIIHPLHRFTYFHLEYGDGLNHPLPQVKAWQALLNCWGYIIEADGEFGVLTLSATRKWQEKAKALGLDVEVNGVVDSDDWEEIIKIPVD